MVGASRIHGVLLASLMAMLVVLAGCGSDGGDEGEAAEGGDGDESEAAEGGDGDDASASEGGEDWPDELVFGAVPSEEAESLTDSWQPLLDALEDELGVDIRFESATDYAAVTEAQISENVDFAFYGPFGYVVSTIAGADIEAVIAQKPEPDLEPGYQSYLITTADRDDIEETADVEGKTVCLVDPSSTSGGLFPHAILQDAGLDPETDVQATYAGAHDASVLSVLEGDCDAGFAFDSMVEEILPADGHYELDEIKIIEKSEVIPGSPIAVGKWLPQDLQDAIQEAIVDIDAEYLAAEGYCDESQQVDTIGEHEPGVPMCPIGDENRWGAEAVDDAYYDGIRKVCELTGAPACDPE